jgi:hypothetical protein
MSPGNSESFQLNSQYASESMISIAFKLLESEQLASCDSSELTFVGLDLLSRLIIPEHAREQTTKRIEAQLGNRVWLMREHAARVYWTQIAEEEAVDSACRLISLMDLKDQNKCHGVLLCAHELLMKYRNSSLPCSDGTIVALEKGLQDHARNIQQYAAPAVKSAFVNVVNSCILLRNQWKSGVPTILANLPGLNGNPVQETNSYAPHIDHERPGSQPRPSLALYNCLVALAGPDRATSTWQIVYEDLASCDLDAAIVLLGALKDKVPLDSCTVQPLMNLYSTITRSHCTEDIAATAMFGLSSCLEHVLRSHTPVKTQLQSANLIEAVVKMPYQCSRDLFNAKNKVLSGLFAYESRNMRSLWNPELHDHLRFWILLLRSAADDLTETPTRLNAAESLHCFRYCLVESCDEHGTTLKLKLLSVLYDFLNDDDEEIRDLSSGTTSFVLSHTSGGGSVQLCPLAASRQLLAYMAKSFSGMDEFHLLALGRVMFSSSQGLENTSKFAMLASTQSVKEQLTAAQWQSYDLFEEERQNLYADDVREIQAWDSALGHIPPETLDDAVRQLVGDWALDGLQELANALPALGGGPFGVLWRVEIMALFVRTISIASRFLQWDYDSGFGRQSQTKSPHLREMESLMAIAEKYPLQPQVHKILNEAVQKGQGVLEQ